MKLRSQGEVQTKRCGVSRSLDVASIDEHVRRGGELPYVGYNAGAMTAAELFTDEYVEWFREQQRHKEVVSLLKTLSFCPRLRKNGAAFAEIGTAAP